MERNYTVYMHQNQINGKRYIGITADTVQSRWRNGAGYKTQIFGRAIEKYGWQNFNHIIIAEYSSQREAARAVGVDQKGISNVIRGKQKMSGGFIWKAI